jgi:lysine biosynthesis protein LysW
MAKAPKTSCPSCGERFTLEPDVAEGDLTYCPACYLELEVVRTDPPFLREAKTKEVEEEEGYGDGDEDGVPDDEEDDPYRNI